VADPRAEYQQRIDRWSAIVRRGERTHLLLSNLRLAGAFAAAVVAWLTFGRHLASPVWVAVPLAAFAALVVAHAKVLHRNERAVRARRLYERGLERIDGRWAASGPDGAHFVGDHEYARDLDLFGPGSLFHLLDAARTEAGEETLANWLRAPAEIEEIRARQAAVAELAPAVDFRESLAVVAAEAHVGRTSALNRWAAHEPVGAGRGALAVFAACGVTTLAVIVAAVLGRFPTSAVLAWVGAQVAIAIRVRPWVNAVVSRVEAVSPDLGVFHELLQTVERVSFTTPRLAGLRARLVEREATPSRRVARLQSLVSLLEQIEHNPYVRLLATPLVGRAQVAVVIDRWHAAHRVELARWITVIGELEAFASLATYAFEHPADPFPELTADGPVFEAAGVAHPLLLESQAVRNDVRIGGAGPRLLVVSGSNMSGKSTLLRAVGVNAVLAQMGAPVRAVQLRMSPLAIGATLRIEDSLHAGHSRFYTEILHIRAIVERARGPVPVLFLLDEILHGTNSHDRRIGAEAIVRALVSAGAIGLVTTHDLALTEVVPRFGARAANVHFEDRIENGRMVFDYRMRDGVVERSNALALMRAIGLDV
jgi:MutS-like protein